MPPVWLMGFCNMPVGLAGAVTLVTVPQLLAAKGVPESAIAWVTTASLVAGFANFLFAPVLDWRLSRRAYAVILAVLAGLLALATLLCIDNLLLLAVLAFSLTLATYLNQAAVGGWLSGVTVPAEKSALGAWLQASNIAGFGIGAAIAILAIRNLPSPLGAAAVGLLELIPIPLYLWIPAVPADMRLGHEGFAAFLRDVLTLLRRPPVRWLMLFLVLPAASFALSNTLSGLGGDFGASEEMVGTVSGIGVAVAGVIGALVAPQLIRGMSPERAYLTIGAGGAIFTLAEIVLPRLPLTFAIGMIGQNAIQAAAFAAVNVMILRSNGQDNPLAATQFALLSAMSSIPLMYMQAVDGQAYGHGGFVASCLTDALLSLATCAVLSLLLRRRGRMRRSEAVLYQAEAT
jgi:PAT family beta-lactamase induction signal transducer AmpG